MSKIAQLYNPSIQSSPSSPSPRPPKKFSCLCSKQYTQYAAIYTHIHNKHSNQVQEYMSGMIRPSGSHNRKGRPKKIHQSRANGDCGRMEVVEIGMCEILERIGDGVYGRGERNRKSKFLLGECQDYNQLIIESHYITITEKYGQPTHSILRQSTDIPPSAPTPQFFSSLCKHLNPQISAKILWTINTGIENNKKQVRNCIDIVDEIMDNHVCEHENKNDHQIKNQWQLQDVWDGVIGMQELIWDIWAKWREVGI